MVLGSFCLVRQGTKPGWGDLDREQEGRVGFDRAGAERWEFGEVWAEEVGAPLAGEVGGEAAEGPVDFVAALVFELDRPEHAPGEVGEDFAFAEFAFGFCFDLDQELLEVPVRGDPLRFEDLVRFAGGDAGPEGAFFPDGLGGLRERDFEARDAGDGLVAFLGWRDGERGAGEAYAEPGEGRVVG